ncbi:Rap1a/Tai family immunity protein [Parahaliea mediterranea]|uniref:Rap1a/Tai family immunity protein n=1 Tax=Parahaliea mediterranea TaxID=651086 RepID=UPI001300633C|nr:Rap1a/Tai family immunity protein [Parahaliea mediterranea]
MMRFLVHAASFLCSTTLLVVLAPARVNAEGSPPELRTGSQLVEACRMPAGTQDTADSGLCEGFLLGYLQAHPEVGFSDQQPSEYMQRVMRTRAPAHPETAALKSQTYCLNSLESVAQIRQAIASRDPASVAYRSATSLVAEVLERDYTCSP